MKRKLFSVVIMLWAVLICLLALPTEAKAATSGYYTYTVTDGEAMITDCDTSISGDVTIPSTLGGYPVTGIGGYAFRACNSLSSITIPDSVTSIGDYAFEYCTGLTSVTIGKEVTSIDAGAFYCCESLTSVTIPESVTSIGEDAFLYCSSLTAIWVDVDNTAYSSDSYGVLFNKNKTELIKAPGSIKGAYTIPDSVTSIGDYAFDYCTGLISVTIGKGVTSIDAGAFYGCDSLTSIWVDVDNTAYSSDGYGVLFNKNKTELIKAPGSIKGAYTIPDSVTNIGTSAFEYCTGLTSVSIGNSVTTIDYWAFYGCDSLTSIVIPDSVTYIGAWAFYDCKITSVKIGAGVTYIDEYAFGGVSDVYITDPNAWCKIEYFDSYFIWNNLYILDAEGNEVRDVSLDDTVTMIRYKAFSGCTSLTSIAIPASVTRIGYSAFQSCNNLTSVTYCGTAEQWDEISIESGNEDLISATSNYHAWVSATCTAPKTCSLCGATDGEKAAHNVVDGICTICQQYGSLGKNLTWELDDEGILTISGTGVMANYGGGAHNPWDAYREFIKSVVIEDGVTSIALSAFRNCTGLTNVTIPDSVTRIGGFAFSGCSSLTNITIPDGVTRIAECAFSDCTRLADITIPEGVTAIGEFAFRNCVSLTNITIPNGVTAIGDEVFRGCTGLTNITIPNGVTSIGYSAFRDCTGLTGIAIPDSVTTIDKYAFYGCRGLTNVTYCGTAERWTEIRMSFGNNNLARAERSYHNWADGTCLAGSTCTLCGATGPKGEHNVVDGICTVCQHYGTCGDNLTWTLDDEGTLTISGTGAMADYEREAYVPWYAYQEQIKKVVIEDGVTSIGNCAFWCCTNLSDVSIPDGVTSIGKFALAGCESLAELDLPDGLLSIGYGAFSEGPTFTSLEIPDTVISIGDYAFGWCDELKSVNIPVGVTSIGESTFFGCSSLESITLSDNVTSIGMHAFIYCNNLRTVTLGKNVQSIGSGAFFDCGITNINIPTSVTSIGDLAFKFCVNLAGIWVDEDNAYYTSDSSGVLFNKNQTELIQAPGAITGAYTIPNSVTTIGDEAFCCCINLTSVTIPASVTSIGGYAFGDCTSLTNVTYCGTEEQWNEIDISSDNECLLNATRNYHNFIDGVCTVCGDKAVYTVTFKDWDGTVLSSKTYLLGEEVVVPADPTRAADETYTYTFAGWDKEVVPCAGDANYTATYTRQRKDGILYSIQDGYVTITDYAGSGGDLIIPDTIENLPVTSIGSRAFGNCTTLTSVTLGKSVTNIDSEAFISCSSLTSITIPDGVASIGDFAFAFCSNLTSINIPDSVTSIGYDACWSCDSLTTVIYCGTEEQWNKISGRQYLAHVPRSYHNWTDTDCVTDSTCTLCGATGPKGAHNVEDGICTVCQKYGTCGDNLTWTLDDEVALTISGTGTMDDYAWTEAPWYRFGAQIRTIVIEDGVSSIGEHAFMYCTGLTSVTIGDSVTSIGKYAFYHCERLPNITIPDSVTTIGNSAFYYCTGLTSMTLGNSVTSIGSDAFYASRLTSIIIPDSLASIGESAFRYCTELTSITIPNSVTSIGRSAFCNCTRLTNITIPDRVTSIGMDAFTGCVSLSSITIPDSVTSISNFAFSCCTSLTSVTIGNGLTSIGSYAFSDCTNLTTVIYGGTEEQWNQISIEAGNDCLLNAAREYQNTANAVCTVCRYETVYIPASKNWYGDVLSSKTCCLVIQ